MAGKYTPMLELATASPKRTPFPTHLQYRNLSSRTLRRQSAAATTLPHVPYQATTSTTTSSPSTPNTPPHETMPKPPPLSVLPLKLLLRNIIVNTISSSRLLLTPSLVALSLLSNSRSPILNPDRNPLLRHFLKNTFYAHFCAGENATEVSRTITQLRSMGYKGVMLCYAKEVVLDSRASLALEASGGRASDATIQNELLPWTKGTLKTVSLVDAGSFVAIKFTGAGSQALYNLSHNLPPSAALEESITQICDLAASRGVRLVFDAEQASLQTGIDAWTLELMRRYNRNKAIVYSTYQAYLKACPSVLAAHLATARREGFVLGVKLVRGAYIRSDPRHLINDSKAETDEMYDALAESVLRRRYGSVLRPADGEEGMGFPGVSLVVASHNAESVRKAMAVQDELAERGEERIDLVYGQLQGMADEVSCELVQRAREVEGERERESQQDLGLLSMEKRGMDVPQVYKYLVWGTTGECMMYLGRRAQENKDAMERTREGRDMMVVEAGRRVKAWFGW